MGPDSSDLAPSLRIPNPGSKWAVSKAKNFNLDPILAKGLAKSDRGFPLFWPRLAHLDPFRPHSSPRVNYVASIVFGPYQEELCDGMLGIGT